MNTLSVRPASAALAVLCFALPLSASEPVPALAGVSVSGQHTIVSFVPFPSVIAYTLSTTDDLMHGTWTPATQGVQYGYTWQTTNWPGQGYFRLELTPLASNRVLAATLLNRLAYGPKPGDIETVSTNPWAYAKAQLAPETLTETIDDDPLVAAYTDALTNTLARVPHLRAWHCLRAVGAVRQFHEILVQFFDNHFNTWFIKMLRVARPYTENYGHAQQEAIRAEYDEQMRWRAALLQTNTTFYDLLRISAESRAMLAYLDTDASTSNRPNENYARELVELFTMGVDNGYIQRDIEQLSRTWTGWGIDRVATNDAGDPHAAVLPPAVTGGVWSFHFDPLIHDEGAVVLFSNRTVDARFGPPFAGQLYELSLPAQGGSNAIQKGYTVLAHLSELPQTMEFICAKLCQLLIHDGFTHGWSFTNVPLTAEAALLRDCMLVWNTPVAGRKGNIRAIVTTIVTSGFFRGQCAAAHKTKTPLEYVVSAIRALRDETNGTYTAATDGLDLFNPMNYMSMQLYQRFEPDGYPEEAGPWTDTGAMIERMRYVQNLLMEPSDPHKDIDYRGGGDDNVSYPVVVVKLRLNPAQWTDAEAVADLFLDILYPAEGLGNLVFDRDAALEYLNSDDSGVPGSSPFALLDHASTEYDARVRGAVAYLMSLPRFNEQ
jgi:uncharacterized protein (DUF1800 family)